MAVKDILDALRQAYPEFKDAPDVEIEAVASAANPDFRVVFERERANEALRARIPKQPVETSAAPPGVLAARNAVIGALPSTVEEGINTAVESLPAVGATVGEMAAVPASLATFGIGGVPAAVAGGGLGGGAGETLRQMIQRARGKETGGLDLTRIGKETAINAALPAAVPLVKGAATSLARQALNAPVGLLNKFNDVTGLDLGRRLLDEGLLANRGRLGRDKAGKLLEQSGRESRAIATGADVAGTPPATLPELQPGFEKPLQQAIDENFPEESLNVLANKERQFAQEHARGRTMSELEREVSMGNRRRAAGYGKQAELGGANAMEAAADIGMTDQKRAVLYNRVPEIVPEKERAKELIAIKKILDKKRETSGPTWLDVSAAGTGAGLGGLFGGGAAAAGFGAAAAPLALRAVRSPTTLSLAAHGLDKVVAPAVAVVTPAIRYRMLLELLRSGQPDEEELGNFQLP